MEKKRITPSLADSTLTRYMRQLWKVNPEVESTYAEYIAKIIDSSHTIVPAGVDEAMIIYERFNLRGVLWNLKENCAFVQTCLSAMQAGTDGVDFVMADSAISGKECLFLVSTCVSPDGPTASLEHVKYCLDSWCPLGMPAHFITGSCKLRADNSVFSAVAVQLSSLKLIDT